MKSALKQSAPNLRLLAAAVTCALSLGAAAQAADLDAIRDRGTLRVAVANEIPCGDQPAQSCAVERSKDCEASSAEKP